VIERENRVVPNVRTDVEEHRSGIDEISEHGGAFGLQSTGKEQRTMPVITQIQYDGRAARQARLEDNPATAEALSESVRKRVNETVASKPPTDRLHHASDKL
jgi:hypothetical protein